jgi:hypothetical protein
MFEKIEIESGEMRTVSFFLNTDVWLILTGMENLL